MARPRIHTDALRDELLGVSLAMVEDAGITALPVRDVAARAGTSTTAVYSLFGGKVGLQRAVILRACDDFASAQAGAGVTDDPARDIAELGVVYVQWALDHPRLYEVIFGQAVVGLEPTPEIERAAARAMAPLTDAVGRAVAAGQFRAAPVEVVAASLWAQVHGIASLLLAGRLDPDLDLASAAAAVIDGWRTGT